MILLIDNYDSFSYNLYQLIGSVNSDIKVIRNDELRVSEIFSLSPSHIVISPGPGRPSDAGICEELVKALTERKIPLLGVCLGHQAICEAFGAEITYAKKLMHGKKSRIIVSGESRLFKGLPNQIEVARYHSLAAGEKSFPDCLDITARTDDGEIMAAEHRTCSIFGVQFHPESILTEHGAAMIKNFLEVTP